MPVATKEPKQKVEQKGPKETVAAPPIPDCSTPGCGNVGSAPGPAQAQSSEVRGQGPQAGGPQAGGPQAAGPQAAGPQAAGPQAASPEPGTGGTGGATPAPTDAQRWTAVQALLQQSALGQQALARQTQYSVGMNWWGGPGSAYNPGSNTMNIDRNRPNERVALTFIHEMNHAYYEQAHLGVHGANNIGNMTRAAYVSGMLSEEAEGTSLSIEGKMELQAAGNTIAPVYPLEPEYRVAYQAIITAGGNVTAARAAGRARVLQGFTNGEVVTSTDPPTPYPQYYGQAWDAQHPASGGSWC